MKIINLRRELVLTHLDGKLSTLKENVDYIVPDGLISKIYQSGNSNGIFYSKDFDEYYNEKLLPPDVNLNGKRLLTFRNGGIGDLLFQLPAIKFLKDKYPESKIFICCSSKYKGLFENLDFIDGLEELPLKKEYLDTFDYYVNFENLIENSAEAELNNAYDLHSKKFHLPTALEVPLLQVNSDIEASVKKEIFPYNAKKKILISYAASTVSRSVNPQIYADLINTFKDREDIIFFISGSKYQQIEIDNFISQKILKQNRRLIKRLPDNYGEDIRYTMALIKNSDCVIGPDSGLLHIAGGLRVPLIGLFGPFPSALRINYYKNAKGLKAYTNCFFARGEWKSCFQHKYDNEGSSCHLADRRRSKYSPCMDYIKPPLIIKKLAELKII